MRVAINREHVLRSAGLEDPAHCSFGERDVVAVVGRPGARSLTEGRATIPMDTYIRLMVLKHRCGWGYETLMREVSDSLHLRRFCRLRLSQRVPDESTVRKLTRRLGAEVVHELTRIVIAKARREKRFRPRAARIDSTVVEADVRYPTDAGLAGDGVRALAREGRKLAAKIGAKRTAVRDRSRAVGKRLRGITRTLRARSGQAKTDVLRLTEQTGELLAKSIREARKLAATARRRARGRGAQAKLNAARKLCELADRCEKVTEQIKRRVAGEPITDRLISLWDPDARPIRKGKLGKPTEFGYVDQLCEITANTKRGARGFIAPAATATGNPSENTLLPDTVSELQNLDIKPREVALDGAFIGRPRAHQRPPRTGLAAHPPPTAALPHRCRGPHQPPQATLRAAPKQAQGRRRPPNLGWMGNVHLQRRHLHHARVTNQPQPQDGKPTSEQGDQARKLPRMVIIVLPDAAIPANQATTEFFRRAPAARSAQTARADRPSAAVRLKRSTSTANGSHARLQL